MTSLYMTPHFPLPIVFACVQHLTTEAEADLEQKEVEMWDTGISDSHIEEPLRASVDQWTPEEVNKEEEGRDKLCGFVIPCMKFIVIEECLFFLLWIMITSSTLTCWYICNVCICIQDLKLFDIVTELQPHETKPFDVGDFADDVPPEKTQPNGGSDETVCDYGSGGTKAEVNTPAMGSSATTVSVKYNHVRGGYMCDATCELFLLSLLSPLF